MSKNPRDVFLRLVHGVAEGRSESRDYIDPIRAHQARDDIDALVAVLR